MNKKLTAALSGGAALVLALSGCGNGSNEKLDAWAKQVCDAVQPQAKKIGTANTQIQQVTSDNSSPSEVRKTDSKAFQDMADAYKSIGAAVDKAGAPDVKNGAKKQRDAVHELNGISTSYADLKKQVDKLDTKNQGKFAEGLKKVASELEKLSQSGNSALKQLEEGEVGQAMAKQESCKKASTKPAGA